jgi:N-methylhydantoinase A
MLAGVTEVVHGSTVATNAILERKGAAVALLVTRGFRDVLLLQRHNRTRIYDLFYRKPVPVVSRADTFEVPERVGPDGAVVEPLDEHAVPAVLAASTGWALTPEQTRAVGSARVDLPGSLCANWAGPTVNPAL